MLRFPGRRFSETDSAEADTNIGSLTSHHWLLAAIALGTTLAPLNSTMIAVALPNIQSELGVSVTQTAWLVTLYLAAMAVGQPIGGRIGDLIGRRPVYLAGLVWFGVASIACAFAPSLEWLLLFRTQQALAGALTFPNGTAIVREFTPPERRGSAFGTIGMVTASAAAIGPPLGGALVHAFGWEAIFWVNVPIIATALLLNLKLLPKSPRRHQERPPFDIAGSALFATALGAFIGIPALLKADRHSLAVAATAAALVAAIGFVAWELRQSHPVVDIRLFSRAEFSAACSSIALSNLVMYTTLLTMPQFLDHVRGDNEQTIGLTLAALSALAAICGFLGGRMTDSRGRWFPAVLGAVILFAGIAMLTGVVDVAALWPVVACLAVMGIGLGIQGAPVQTAAVEAVPMAKTGSAAGVFSTSRYMGSVTGATVLAIVFANDADTANGQTYQWLFAGLAVVALVGIAVNALIAPRRTP